MQNPWAQKQTGFTIVELLIVIVVIAILAAITIVAYNGIQSRAKDSQKKQDVEQIAKLIQLYDVDNGPMWTGSGCGSAGNGSGWFNVTYSGYISDSQCLVNAKVTTTNVTGSQQACTATADKCDAYMKYTCSQSGQVVTYIYARLETSSMDLTGTCGSGGAPTTYGMNYYVRVVDQ